MNSFDLHPHYLRNDYFTKEDRARVEEIEKKISSLKAQQRQLEDEKDKIYQKRREKVLRFALQNIKRSLNDGQLFILQPDATSLLNEKDFEGLVIKSRTLTMTNAEFCFSLEPDGSFEEFELTRMGELVVKNELDQSLADQIKAQKLDTWDFHSYPKESTLPLGSHFGKCMVFLDIEYICLDEKA